MDILFTKPKYVLSVFERTTLQNYLMGESKALDMLSVISWNVHGDLQTQQLRDSSGCNLTWITVTCAKCNYVGKNLQILLFVLLNVIFCLCLFMGMCFAAAKNAKNANVCQLRIVREKSHTDTPGSATKAKPRAMCNL